MTPALHGSGTEDVIHYLKKIVLELSSLLVLACWDDLLTNIHSLRRSDSSDFQTSMQMVVEAADKDDTDNMDMEFLKVCLEFLLILCKAQSHTWAPPFA